jgi:tetratricopeptide (TPR) repeat protein
VTFLCHVVAQRYAGHMAANGDPGTLDRSLLEVAEGQRRAGRLADARSGFTAAARAAEGAGDSSAFVQAALGLGGIWVHEQRDVVARAAAQALWDRARTLVEGGSLEEARLDVRLAAEAVYMGAPVDAVAVATDRVRSFGHDAATADALSQLHHVQLGPRYAESRLALAEEIVMLATRAADPLLTLMGLCWRTVDLFLLGDSRAGQSLDELRTRSEAEGCQALAYVADVLGIMVLARAGKLPEAEEAAGRALERGAAVGDPDAWNYYGAVLAALRYWQGRAAEMIDLVRTTSTSPLLGFNDHVYVAVDAMFSAAVGDTDSAEEALARLSGLGLERLPYSSSSWLTTQLLVAETAYLLGDAQTAAACAEIIAPYAHLPVMPSLGVVCFGSAERALGLCAATTGRADAAVHHLDAAIRTNRRLGSRPMAVLCEHALAGVLAVRDGPGDGARAGQLTRRAEERAGRLGMVLPNHPSWLAPGEFGQRTTEHQREASLQRGPAGWRLTVDGRASHLPDRVGLRYLIELLARPDRELDVVQLASDGLVAGARSDLVADPAALLSYRRRARELRALLDDGHLDPALAAHYGHELNALNDMVRSSTGLGGRARGFPDTNERARTAVRKALMRAIDFIEAVEPDLGHHLRGSVTTGVTCRYTASRGWRVTTQR